MGSGIGDPGSITARSVTVLYNGVLRAWEQFWYPPEHKKCTTAIQWRHNGRDCVSNHQPPDCLLSRLFRRRSKKTSKLRVTDFVRGIHRDSWNPQASLHGLPERQHLGKTVHCWGWSDRIVSWVLGPWHRGWEICTEWGLVAQRLTTNSCPVVTGHTDPQRSPADCQPPSSPLGVGADVAEPDSGPLAACHLRWWVVIPTLDGRLRVRRLPGERFRPGCQAHRVQAGGCSVHVWGAFHNSAKSHLVLPDGYLTGVLYRGIWQNALVPFARHYFGDNYRYQDDNATPHRARVVLDFLQQGNVTKMEQPPRSPDCNPIEYLWDELGREISSMDNPPQNLDELRQALLDKWAQIPVQRLQRLVASMPRRLAAIIAAGGGNTRYWPGIHKTRPSGSVTKKASSWRPLVWLGHLWQFVRVYIYVWILDIGRNM